MYSYSMSLCGAESCLESRSLGFPLLVTNANASRQSKSTGYKTAPTHTGPAKAPRPASSMPMTKLFISEDELNLIGHACCIHRRTPLLTVESILRVMCMDGERHGRIVSGIVGDPRITLLGT